MKTFHYRTVISNFLHDHFGIVIQTNIRNVEYDFDFSYSARFAEHVFGYFKAGLTEFDIHVCGSDTHSSNNACSESDAHGVRWTEPFAFASVVCWCICFYNGTALKMSTFASEVAFINN
jgi:hypothetical protein